MTAVIAATAVGWSALLQRRTGRETTEASKESAKAAQASAQAAADSVKHNRAAEADAAERATAAAYATRYQDAASQLGHEKAAVRLAGVYAMCRLADDWNAERQTCIDVLCAYLRLPWDEPDSKAAREDLQVRRTIASVINSHVTEDVKASWSANNFDFTGAQFRDFALADCVFGRHVTFSGATFSGECSLADIKFESGASFESCIVDGFLRLREISARESSQISFKNSQIKSGAKLEITTNTKDPGRVFQNINFESITVCGTLHIKHARSKYKIQAPISLDMMNLAGGSIVITTLIHLTKDRSPLYPNKIMARRWSIKKGSEIKIPKDLIEAKIVDFGNSYKREDIPDDLRSIFNFPAPEE